MGYLGGLSAGVDTSGPFASAKPALSDGSNFNELQGQVLQSLSDYSNATGEALSSGMESYMPSMDDDLGSLTNTALYSALSPQDVGSNNISSYVAALDQGMFHTDLTSPQAMADRARMSDLFSGI